MNRWQIGKVYEKSIEYALQIYILWLVFSFQFHPTRHLPDVYKVNDDYEFTDNKPGGNYRSWIPWRRLVIDVRRYRMEWEGFA